MLCSSSRDLSQSAHSRSWPGGFEVSNWMSRWRRSTAEGITVESDRGHLLETFAKPPNLGSREDDDVGWSVHWWCFTVSRPFVRPRSPSP